MIGKTKKLSAFIVGLMTAISCSSGIIPDNTSQQADAAASRVLAFPGAVGGGKYSTGGRGGEDGGKAGRDSPAARNCQRLTECTCEKTIFR